jgi:hypothetical protein
MPDRTIDPAWGALAAHGRAARVELDKLDVLADHLEAADRGDLLPRLVAIREALDQFDAELEAKAAGL